MSFLLNQQLAVTAHLFYLLSLFFGGMSIEAEPTIVKKKKKNEDTGFLGKGWLEPDPDALCRV